MAHAAAPARARADAHGAAGGLPEKPARRQGRPHGGLASDLSCPERCTRENIVYCNWDLDADRGYGYKQWKTNLTPRTSYNLADERYCRYAAPGSWIDGVDEV